MRRQAGACFHCGLPLPPDETVHGEVDGEKKFFCCKGCKAVSEAIYEAGLQGFYERSHGEAPYGPPPSPPEDIAAYDLPEIRGEFVTKAGDGDEASLLVEGIHCAACVWLIERALAKTPGVTGAEVNMAARKLKVRWDPARIKLSGIIHNLSSIGYSAVPYSLDAADESARARLRGLLYRMGFAGFAAMNMMWVAIALWTGAGQDEYRDFFRWVGFALATPTLFYSAGPFFIGAVRGLSARSLTMDLPIVIGASVTYAYSIFVTMGAIPTGEVYFDTVVTFIFVILIGRYLEAAARRRAWDATGRLVELAPRVATIITDGVARSVPVKSVKIDELALVRPGEKIGVDGVVVDGESEVDESALTGESRPVPVGAGRLVVAGSMNGSGALTVRVTRLSGDTAIARMVRLMEKAQASRGRTQRLTDKVVPWFVSGTLSIAMFTFLYWWRVAGVEMAIIASTSVLIITCPCALGMAAPMSVVVASGAGARRGIFVKSGEALETLSKVNHFVFDKTGALTEGKNKVTAITPFGHFDEDGLLRLAAAVEWRSEHPLAKAIVREAAVRAISADWAVENFNAKPGCGVRAVVNGEKVVAGNAVWLADNGAPVEERLLASAEDEERKGATCVFVAVSGKHAGRISVSDDLRKGSVETVNFLRSHGYKITMLTGDRWPVAETVSARLGGMNVKSQMLPEDKEAAVRGLRESGDVVAMVGDGVNDAPALVRADVGIALSSGADVSVESADIVITGSSLGGVTEALGLARRTMDAIRKNITISIAYNMVMAPLAAAGYLTPVFAAIAMPLSSLLVIGVAIRIDRKRPHG
ncbi:MAG: heavy metal translocating P-type ATPase [Nitrospinae bacterium]|nr:heavy metal translocating P-type ATPase [Nitrospinota bacterium]MBF0633908.1 heavy metal translocating P-type ATPase [Nitrospinota bacterium]